jgi:hypothetical protein
MIYIHPAKLAIASISLAAGRPRRLRLRWGGGANQRSGGTGRG